MASVEIPDFSFIDVDELGMRPHDWVEDGNGMEFDGTGQDYFGVDKSLHFDPYTSLKSGKKFLIDETNTNMSDDDDFLNDSQYEIDPETGEKVFREAVIASSPSFVSSSASNFNWIEEYLSNLPATTSLSSSSSSSTYHIPAAPRRTNDLYSNHFSYPSQETEWKSSQWFPKYPTVDQTMFSSSIMHPFSSPTSMPLAHGNQFTNTFSASGDDEHSTSSSSSGSRRRRYQSSLESESTTRDSESLFDGHMIETKLEKLEHDESNMHPLFLRRSSTRSNCQGQQDEDLLRRCGVPLTLADITQSSTEEYNRHLTNLIYLTPEQIHVIKDIRRRGKNKVAAQNCRKRKATGVESLLDEVDELKRVKQELEEKKRSFQKQINQTRHQYEYLHQQALPNRQLPPAISVK